MACKQNGNGGSTDTSAYPAIIELNVGGVFYSTSLSTLTNEPQSRLGQMFGSSLASASSAGDGSCDEAPLRDSKGKYFIDRDGVLFRYILDYLRNKKLVLPENFQETKRLMTEAEYFQLPSLLQMLSVQAPPSSFNDATADNTNDTNTLSPSKALIRPPMSLPTPQHPAVGARVSSASTTSATTPTSPRPSATDLSSIPGGPGNIVIGYRGTFAFGRDGLADVKFRKLTRILVHGRVNLCREVFGDTLNESRDPDRGTNTDRYTARFFLKHTSLEQAFDGLLDAGFYLAGCCGTGTSNAGNDIKPGMDTEENRWNHYNEFVFVRN